jgi:hypothetical protein
MTHFKRKPLLSLLLALVMVVTMLPMSALAAEETDIPATEVCTDEHCAHEHESAETADVILFSLIPNKPGLPRILL